MLIEFIKERSELYHVSSVNNKKSILSTGLRGPVYLTPDYDYIISEDDDFYHDLSVFVVNVEGLSLEEDPEYGTYGVDDEESVAYIYRGDIPADRITYIGDLKYTMINLDHPPYRMPGFTKSKGFKDHKLKDGDWDSSMNNFD